MNKLVTLIASLTRDIPVGADKKMAKQITSGLW